MHNQVWASSESDTVHCQALHTASLCWFGAAGPADDRPQCLRHHQQKTNPNASGTTKSKQDKAFCWCLLPQTYHKMPKLMNTSSLHAAKDPVWVFILLLLAVPAALYRCRCHNCNIWQCCQIGDGAGGGLQQPYEACLATCLCS